MTPKLSSARHSLHPRQVQQQPAMREPITLQGATGNGGSAPPGSFIGRPLMMKDSFDMGPSNMGGPSMSIDGHCCPTRKYNKGMSQGPGLLSQSDSFSMGRPQDRDSMRMHDMLEAPMI